MRNAIKILEKICEKCPPNFNLQLWDGQLITRCEHPQFTIIFHDVKAFKRLLFAGNALTIGEAFIEKKFDIEGDIFAALKFGDTLAKLKFSLLEKLGILIKLIML